MENGLKNLVDISRYYGRDKEYVIAGGGNTSYKNNDFMWIKASGTMLATIDENGFAKMDRECLEKIAKGEYSKNPYLRENEVKEALNKCIADKSGLRPSVETSLHNLLNFSYVIHTHPTLVNSIMCANNSAEVIKELFGDEVLLVEYTDPGYILFKLVEKRIGEFRKLHHREPNIIFLENHGVFVAANSCEEIKALYSEISSKICSRIQAELPSTEVIISENPSAKVLTDINKNLIVRFFKNELTDEFTKNKLAFSQVDTAFSPDNIVYCKAYYLFSNPQTLKNDYLEFEKKYGYFPKVIALENIGILCVEESEKSVNTVYDVFLDMCKISFYSRNFGGPRFLKPSQIEFIDNWEVEIYRRKVNKNE